MLQFVSVQFDLQGAILPNFKRIGFGGEERRLPTQPQNSQVQSVIMSCEDLAGEKKKNDHCSNKPLSLEEQGRHCEAQA